MTTFASYVGTLIGLSLSFAVLALIATLIYGELRERVRRARDRRDVAYVNRTAARLAEPVENPHLDPNRHVLEGCEQCREITWLDTCWGLPAHRERA